jgi:hypothetical protein
MEAVCCEQGVSAQGHLELVSAEHSCAGPAASTWARLARPPPPGAAGWAPGARTCPHSHTHVQVHSRYTLPVPTHIRTLRLTSITT